ncbi:cytochrome c oxidase assembly protein, partial [Streptomyces sp. NPDC089915]
MTRAATAAGSLPELSWGSLLSSWQLDLPALLVAAVLGGLYGWGVLRVRRRGESWPLART